MFLQVFKVALHTENTVSSCNFRETMKHRSPRSNFQLNLSLVISLQDGHLFKRLHCSGTPQDGSFANRSTSQAPKRTWFAELGTRRAREKPSLRSSNLAHLKPFEIYEARGFSGFKRQGYEIDESCSLFLTS